MAVTIKIAVEIKGIDVSRQLIALGQRTLLEAFAHFGAQAHESFEFELGGGAAIELQEHP